MATVTRGERVQGAVGGESVERRAVVFVAGAGGGPRQAVETVAQKLRGGLETAAPVGAAFRVESPVRTETFGAGGEARVATITRTAGGDAFAAVDVYAIELGGTLTSGYAGHGPARRALLSLLLLAFYVPVVGRLLGGGRRKPLLRDPGRKWRIQLMIGFSVLALQGVYLLMAGWAIAATAWPGLSGVWERLPQALLLGATAVGISKPALVRRLSDAAATASCAVYYLRMGYQRNAVSGRLLALLRHVATRQPAYSAIDVVAYSFGSVIVLDTLFPPDGEPSELADRVDGLVTIGLPFETVRTYFPTYFDGRPGKADSPRWLNVWSAGDVLSSSFGGADERPTLPEGWCGPAPEPAQFGATHAVGLLDIVLAAGLREHSTYWGERDGDERNAFGAVAAHLYKGTKVVG